MDEEKKQERADRLRIAGAWGVVTSADELLIIQGKCRETKCVSAVRQWSKDNPEGFLGLLGTVGCGKTMACLDTLASNQGKYVTARKLERIFAANWGPDRNEQEEICESRLLVLDDLGTERDLSSFAGVFYEVVDLRQGHGRWTVFTANLSRSQFFERYRDPRLARRLSRAFFISDTGPDLTHDGPTTNPAETD